MWNTLEDPQFQIEYWPAPLQRERPNWIWDIKNLDEVLGSLVANIYLALDRDMRAMAAVGMRTAFDRASELLDIDTEKSFAHKLDELVTSNRISPLERDHLETLTEASSAAVHRGWKPSIEELNFMSDILEGFLSRAFVLPAGVRKVKNSIPPRSKRQGQGQGQGHNENDR